MKTEITLKPQNGFAMLGLALFLVAGAALSIYALNPILAGLAIAGFIFVIPGFLVVNPKESVVLTLFGSYSGSVKTDGFFWVNPFTSKLRISLRARNTNVPAIKVNDKNGNPIEIASVIVWHVEDTARAAFEADNYLNYVNIQSEAALSHLAGTCPYDDFDGTEHVVTLRGGGENINGILENELNERLKRAGIVVTEARISHLAYAPEIAGAMLQRQQASAVVSARKQIVEGAVGMVEMALEKLSEREIVHLDEERKAAMVSNLLVVLCGERNVSPIVNAGTLHN